MKGIKISDLIVDKFYYLYSKHETKPVLVHYYLGPDTKDLGFGFNTYDGGGFAPLHDLTKDTVIVRVDIVEIKPAKD